MYSTNLNGPVLPEVFTYRSGFSVTPLLTMFIMSNRSNIAGRGRSDVNSTVYLSGVSIDVHHLLIFVNCAPMFGCRTRSKLYLTSSLVNSRPVWKVTFLRRFSLMRLKSLLTSQLSANIGCGLKLSS